MDLTRTPDEFVLTMLRETFAYITGERFPIDKGSNKNPDGMGTADKFAQSSWLHLMMFMHAFHEAKRRGIMNAVEERMGQEIIDMIGE